MPLPQESIFPDAPNPFLVKLTEEGWEFHFLSTSFEKGFSLPLNEEDIFKNVPNMNLTLVQTEAFTAFIAWARSINYI